MMLVFEQNRQEIFGSSSLFPKVHIILPSWPLWNITPIAA
jgi:hypothetical protein